MNFSKMNKTELMLALFFFLFVAFVKASALSYDDYMEVNETENIYFVPFNSSCNAIICFQAECFNMTNQSDKYSIFVTNAAEEDINFTATAYCNETNVSVNGTMLWRVPFNLDVYLLRQNDSSSSALTPYTNEFDYIYLQKSSLSSTSSTDLSYLNGLFDWIPFYNDFLTVQQNIDTTQSFWCVQSLGFCRIKLYENGTYNLFIMKTKAKMSINYWQYEFIKPQNTEKSFDSRIASNVKIPLKEDGTITLYATLWEVNKAKVVWNWVFYAGLIAVWGVLVVCMCMFAPMYAIQGIIGLTVAFLIVAKVAGWVWL